MSDKGWGYTEITNDRGIRCGFQIAPSWSPSHIKMMLDDKSKTQMIISLVNWKNTNKGFDWECVTDSPTLIQFIIFDNRVDKFSRKDNKTDMTEKVFAVLRGKGEKWNTGRKETSEVWSA